MSLARSAFLADLGFQPDSFQEDALDALDAGRSVLVAAPTGSGKTLVAEYAVARALAGGSKAFYTTPLKALSNQKYGDLVRAHGSERVGLLTGDNAIRGDAPVVVMTTEVLRNMVYAGSAALDNLRYVVLDEVHYLQNPYRGAVWEEVIIHLPRTVHLVCLSATVSNAEEFAEWLGAVRGDTATIIEERRPVSLRHLYIVGDRAAERLHVLPTFVDDRPNPEAVALDARSRQPRRAKGRSRLRSPRRTEVVERLAEESLLPALYFIFSRAGCEEAVRHCMQDGVRLTTAEDRPRIRAIAEEKVSALSDGDLAVLGYGPWLSGLEAGLASHHAGMVPPFKEAVEALFAAALVKVVFATETLSLGINMPARTAVIERLSKFTGERREPLSPGEYTQLTGRAGRRGIDEVGYAGVLWSPVVSFGEVAGLASRRTYALTSSFRPTYNMAANLVRRYPSERARHLLNLSFAQFRADAEVVRLEADLDAARQRLDDATGQANSANPPAHLRTLDRAQRLGAEVARLERRVQGRQRSLGRQLDRVLALLEDAGFVSGWELTPPGERLARIYHETDLLVAEAIGQGLFDGLDPAGVAALASVFTFEPRGRGPLAAPSFPDKRLRDRWSAVEDLSRSLAAAETKARLPETRPLDPGFLATAHRWASGTELSSLLGEDAPSGGDFVRNVKQLVDLLRQIAQVAPVPDTARAARRAVDRVLRGIVAASSVVGVPDRVEAGAVAAGSATLEGDEP